MNVGCHELSQCRVDHPVAVDPTTASKGIGNDDHFEVSTAILGSLVTGMQVTLVFDKQLVGCESVGQNCLYHGGPLAGHGKTRLNGLTVTLPYTPAAM